MMDERAEREDSIPIGRGSLNKFSCFAHLSQTAIGHLTPDACKVPGSGNAG
ncbi:hypothetical protein ASZ90_011353 [hydrocarbon metagenome]|uniref:Uncharacterized protein n=1 Tax=hydrocarbon metagenome TaxID=938273 RepID=A0A0W8FDH4_9ZZZZ